ncbi:MAG: hypothetical protein ABMA64_30265 [Myxococcota bacterium]
MWIGLVGAAWAEDLGIDEGTFEIGGQATANIVLADGVSDVYLELAPSGGYFVSDTVELLAGLSLHVDEGTLGVGFFAGLDAFLGTEGVAPYVGGTVGYGMARFAPNSLFVYSQDAVTLSGRGGVVLPLNRKVGVDLGARLHLNIDDGATWVELPLGYIGVRAFFP